MKKKTFALLLSLVLVFGVVAGGTFAWLVDKSAEVKNTFTYGDINIDLTETLPENRQAKIIPGVDIAKDPKVTVKANSEACWLFVKVEENNWPDFKNGTARKVDYAIATGWTKLTGVEGVDDVYYREVAATGATAQEFYVLAGKGTTGDLVNGVVTVSENLTKTEVNSITAGTQPTLTFTAYAVQKDGVTSVTDAWAKASAN